jgi:hypothetical protein
MEMNITRRCIRLLGLLAIVAAFGSLLSQQVKAQQSDSIDGTWQGTLDYVHGAGLLARVHPPQIWRLTIQGASVRAFLISDGKAREIKSGKYKIERYMTNAVIYVIDTGKDSDGTWIETETFLLLQKTPDTLGVTFAGAINNTSLPLDRDISKAFNVMTGDFSRTK